MTLASIVAGNTVVLKPSSDSPAIAYKFFEVLEQVGVPVGVVNFCPCPGGSVGDVLVGHPRTRYVAFTGSKEVGLRINALAAQTAPGQIWIKRVVAEMGGKDSIIVDSETDLDQAVEGVTAAAFGYQGQKCSACSRAIVDAKVYDAFLEKLKARVEKIKVGPTTDPENFMGPVINASSKKSILGYIEKGLKEGGRLVTGGGEAPGPGQYLQPTVIADVAPKATIAQEEIFGPVLAVIKAKNFDDALEIANNTEFGLTGAVYTRNRQKLERAAEEFFVGNLYLNRKCTGALVGAHPFGGFNMSGTDSKGGGQDYLLLFTQAKTVAEKLGVGAASA
jgi:1-pyrroline-5-carboxylate dehydrogenase